MPIKLSRLRKNRVIRDLVSETQLRAQDFILPYFVVEGRKIKKPIESMPGVYHFSIDNLIKDILEAEKLGIKAVLLFGVNNKKNKLGTYAYQDDGIIQKAVRVIKKEVNNLTVITDVCLCGYTTSGHCGIVKKLKVNSEQFTVNNDKTVKILAKIALSHARAGADFVAPSAMMDGQVGAIREILDKNGFGQTGILAYSAKYASNFYGPFRDALHFSPQFGDRKSYQMDYRNSDEALHEIEEDIKEGADIVMVKPALAYLDIICKAKQSFDVPIAAYNVSGEYSMVKAYCKKSEDRNQKIEKDIVLEILTSIKRAGADLIISYHAKEAAIWLK